MSNAERPVIDLTEMRTRDAAPQYDFGHDDGWTARPKRLEHEFSSATSEPTQICFESWSAAFDASDFVLPPPRMLVGRELRSRPRTKPLLVVTPPPGDMCQKKVDADIKESPYPPYPSTRAWHNRSVGSSLLESEGSDRDQWASISRSVEFDVFLLGLLPE